MDRLLEEVGFSAQQIQAAALLVIGRLVAPGSERSTLEWAQRLSGIGELLGAAVRQWSETLLYRVSDRLVGQKERIEEGLSGMQRGLFELPEKVILYDLTNTYFEGSRYESELLCHGKSKEKRHDCPLLTMGLVIDEWSFAKRSEFFAGNTDESATLEGMLKVLGAKPGATVVLDAGIATKENLALVRRLGLQYLCMARGRPVQDEEAELAEGALIIHAEGDLKLKAKLLKGEEEYLLVCESSQRRAKEQGMKDRFQKRFEEGLEAIRESLKKTRGGAEYRKVVERIGRLKERSHGIHQYYEIQLEHHEGVVRSLRYRLSAAEQADQRYAGRYCIRTSRTDLSEKEIWQLYVTLAGIEDSFRSLKSELGMRPVYHFADRRIKAHVFITVLAYHLLQAIRYRLRQDGYTMRWSTLRRRLSTHVLATVSMRTADGRPLSIRTASSPELPHRDVYRSLGLRMSPIRVRRSVA